MGNLIVIGGATATGKSDLAVAVAQEIGGQIVNADSMQLYKGMDIGTAKLSMAEREGIAHHMLDLVKVSTDVTVAWYQEHARNIIDQLLELNVPTVVVGGTGFYIKAILDELNFPDTDPQVRAKLTQEAEEIGAHAMHQRLARLDPAAALAIPKENLRRVIRALEVIEITGLPFTANLPREGSARYPLAKQFGLVLDRPNLDTRIDNRVEKMWEQGIVNETEVLIEQGLLQGKTAQAALGYAQIIKMKAGEITQIEAKAETKRATRQYARRQETWFSRDARIQWIAPASTATQLSTVLAAIVKS